MGNGTIWGKPAKNTFFNETHNRRVKRGQNATDVDPDLKILGENCKVITGPDAELLAAKILFDAGHSNHTLLASNPMSKTTQKPGPKNTFEEIAYNGFPAQDIKTLSNQELEQLMSDQIAKFDKVITSISRSITQSEPKP